MVLGCIQILKIIHNSMTAILIIEPRVQMNVGRFGSGSHERLSFLGECFVEREI